MGGLCENVLLSFGPHQGRKIMGSDAKDAFIIFDEAYEGNDVDAFYLGDILRALGCKGTDAVVKSHGGLEELGQKRITFAEFGPILEAVNADLSSTGYACDYVEGLKIFDKDGSGKIPLPEIKNALITLGDKFAEEETNKLCDLLGIVADAEDFVDYMDFIDKLIAAAS